MLTSSEGASPKVGFIETTRFQWDFRDAVDDLLGGSSQGIEYTVAPDDFAALIGQEGMLPQGLTGKHYTESFMISLYRDPKEVEEMRVGFLKTRPVKAEPSTALIVTRKGVQDSVYHFTVPDKSYPRVAEYNRDVRFEPSTADFTRLVTYPGERDLTFVRSVMSGLMAVRRSSVREGWTEIPKAQFDSAIPHH